MRRIGDDEEPRATVHVEVRSELRGTRQRVHASTQRQWECGSDLRSLWSAHIPGMAPQAPPQKQGDLHYGGCVLWGSAPSLAWKLQPPPGLPSGVHGQERPLHGLTQLQARCPHHGAIAHFTGGQVRQEIFSSYLLQSTFSPQSTQTLEVQAPFCPSPLLLASAGTYSTSHSFS